MLLFATGLFAGFVDSIAGGGGLISVPVLMTTGMSPQMVLGTNKLQSSFGAFSSVCNYTRKGVVDLRSTVYGVICTILGAVFGTISVQLMDPSLIRHLIPILLVPVFVYSLVPGAMDKKREARLPRRVFFLFAGILFGFYDGFFGPGVGSFWASALVFFMGMELTQATGNTKVMNFTSNIVALSLFIIGGNVNYAAGFVMAAGSILGARAGSSLAVRKGSRFIRPFFVSVVMLTMVRLIYQNYGYMLMR